MQNTGQCPRKISARNTQARNPRAHSGRKKQARRTRACAVATHAGRSIPSAGDEQTGQTRAYSAATHGGPTRTREASGCTTTCVRRATKPHEATRQYEAGERACTSLGCRLCRGRGSRAARPWLWCLAPCRLTTETPRPHEDLTRPYVHRDHIQGFVPHHRGLARPYGCLTIEDLPHHRGA